MSVGIPNPTKPVLRRLRRAATATVHDRLNDVDQHIVGLASRLNEIDQHLGDMISRSNAIDQRLRDIASQSNAIERRVDEVATGQAELAESQTALLQSEIHLVDAQAHSRRVQDAAFTSMRSLIADVSERSQRAFDAEFAAIRSSFERMFEENEDLRHATAALLRSSLAKAQAQQQRSLDAAVTTIHSSSERIRGANEGLRDEIAALIRSHLTDVYEQNKGVLNAELAKQSVLFERLLEMNEDLRREIAPLATQPASFERLLEMNENLRHEIASLASVGSFVSEVRNHLATQVLPQITIETSDYASANPELGLMSFLYSYLPTHNAIDVGAHAGEVTQYLLNAGYDVHAFEPYPPTYERMLERINNHTSFKAFPMALGSQNGEALLHLADDSTSDGRFDDPTAFHSLSPHGMPEGLAFTSTVTVPVRRLADLHRDGVIPPAEEISLVKIDTEGYDLEVIRGMGDCRYPVVAVEFWDVHIPFADGGLRYTAPEMVAEMRQRGYSWYIVLYRVWGQDQIGFFSNHDRPVPNSWGNLVFFADRSTFVHAQQWCSAVLPRTFFKPVAPGQSSQRLSNGQH